MNHIKVIEGNMFSTQCSTVVNTVNCIGVMGAGVALEFKHRYPDMFDQYVKLCRQGQIDIGKLWLYKPQNKNRRWVLNFPTKFDWKHPSKIEYLERGLEKFLSTYREKGIESIAWPLLGASNGGIDPSVSRDIMIDYLSEASDIQIEIYQYSPKHKDDLIDILQEALNYSSPKEIKSLSGLTPNSSKKLVEAINLNRANSVMGLARVRGIGKDTVGKAFKLALSYYDTSTKVDLFSPVNNQLDEKEIDTPLDIDTGDSNLSKTESLEKESPQIKERLILLQGKLNLIQDEINSLLEVV